MENSSDEVEYKTLREKLEAEIAPVAWEDLQLAFARGITLFVVPKLKLLDAAVEIAEDNTELVQKWMTEQKILVVTDQQAKDWNESNANLLTAIVKPWVLIQTIEVS